MSDADHLLFVSVLCIWSIMCILFAGKQFTTAVVVQKSLVVGRLGDYIFSAVPWYLWVLSVELPSCHVTSVWNFKVSSRFLETLCILEWYYSKSSLFHVKCILSKLIFNILTFWMVQDSLLSYIYIYLEIYHICYMFHICSKYWHFQVLKN